MVVGCSVLLMYGNKCSQIGECYVKYRTPNSVCKRKYGSKALDKSELRCSDYTQLSDWSVQTRTRIT